MGAVYSQLSLSERRKIENWWHAEVPVREMSRVLNRHKSTIFREIKRNFWADDAFPKKYAGYFGHAAQLTVMSAFCSVRMMSHTLASLDIGKLILSCSNNALDNQT
jgi:IS30 family transposase